MSYMETFIQNDMSGGENSLVPPDSIGDNEVTELVNLLPRRTELGVRLREGFSTIADLGEDVLSLFIKTKTDGTKHLLAAVANGTQVDVKNFGVIGDTGLGSIGSSFVSASAALSGALTPYAYLDADGSIYWYEDWTSDTWDTQPSYWNDTTVWSRQPEVEMAFTFSTEAVESAVRPIIQTDPRYGIGRYSLYVTKQGGTKTAVGTYTTDQAPTVSFSNLEAGTHTFHIAPLDNPSVSGITGGRVVGIEVLPLSSSATIHTYSITPSSFGKMYWSDWDGNGLFFTNNDSGVYYYDFSGVAALVTDESSSATPKPTIAEGKYITQHKGRLFYARKGDNDSFTTVAVCGSDDSVNPRWKSWSGLTASSGGSVDITPYGTNITGLASSYGGLLVFKEKSISLWSYADSVAPWDASGGASVEQLITGVGCVEHDSIVANNNSIYFLGRTDAGDIGLFKIDGSEVTALSMLVPKQMKRLVLSSQSKVSAETFDNYYMLVARSSESAYNSVVAVYDMEGGSWSTYDTPTVFCLHRSKNDPFILLGGTDGKVMQYPSGRYYDNNSDPIRFKIATRRIVNNDTNHEAYFRMVWISGGAEKPTTITPRLVGAAGESFTLTPVQMTSSDVALWNDGSYWNDGGTWGVEFTTDEYYTEADFRTRGAILELSGEAASDTYIDTISVGYRPRRVGNAKYA